MLITIVSLLAVLIVLVLAHECGHFFTARATGVRVEEFGLFFPPRLFSIKRGETRYSINALPIGGFVKLAGEEDPSVPGSLAGKSTGVRVLVLAAGSVMNALLPIILFSVAFMIPHDVLSGQVLVQEVAVDSPAERAGIEAGDAIIMLNGNPVRNIGDVQQNIQLKLGQEVDILVEHGDSTRETVQVVPSWRPPEWEWPVGVGSGTLLVAEVEPGSPADQAGIKTGDVLLSVNGNPVHSIEDLRSYIQPNPDKEITILVKHEDLTTKEVQVIPRLNPPEGQVAIGVQISSAAIVMPIGISVGLVEATIVRDSYPFWKAIPKGAIECVETYVLFKNVIIGMIIGTAPVLVAGPVGIAQVTGEAARAGLSYLLQFAAFFSINLAIINIFPLPALDGGRIVFVLLEWIRRGKRVSPKVEGMVHLIGFAALIAVMIAITYRDIIRIITGESLIP